MVYFELILEFYFNRDLFFVDVVVVSNLVLTLTIVVCSFSPAGYRENLVFFSKTSLPKLPAGERADRR